jgi:hypothetical protein
MSFQQPSNTYGHKYLTAQQENTAVNLLVSSLTREIRW